MRLTDDLVDSETSNASTQGGADEERIGGTERRDRLAVWRAATRSLAESREFDENVRRALRQFPNADDYWAVLTALREVRRRFVIPVDALLAVVDGMEFDLTPSLRTATLVDSLDYCDKAATAVGLALLSILGTSPATPELLASARGFGRALQWTNFLRDVVEDVRRDRIYFPATDFAASELDVDRWRRLATSKNGVRDARSELRDVDSPLSRFFRIQFERTNVFFRESDALFSFVDADSLRPLRLMRGVYLAIFRKIEAAPFRVFGRRARASFWQKARLLGRIMLSSSAK